MKADHKKAPARMPVTPGMADARIQVLEQQIASGLFKGKKLKALESELETLESMYPRE